MTVPEAAPAKKRRTNRPTPVWKYCRQGHKLTPANTIVSGKHRKCRICWEDYLIAFQLGWRAGKHRKPQVTCKRGHRYTAANTRWSKRGTCICRRCLAMLTSYYRSRDKRRTRKFCPNGHPMIPGNTYLYGDLLRCCQCQRDYNETHNKKMGVVKRSKPPANEAERWEQILKDFNLGMSVGCSNLTYGDDKLLIAAEHRIVHRRYAKGHLRKRLT